MSILRHKEAKALLKDAEVDASSVRGCRRRLTKFLERYLPLFYRKEQRINARRVIEGRLSHLERKTCEPIARQAGVQRKPLQQFVGGGKWDDEAVMGKLRKHIGEAFDDPEATLVLDGSSFPKKGTESCGVARQWCGRDGQVENCQVGVFLGCVSRGRVAPLDRRLYLPREWAESPSRRRKCHVPRNVRFAERWRLGLELLKRARDVPHGWIVADDEFGRAGELRAALRRSRQRYILDVPCNSLVRVRDGIPYTAKRRQSRKGGRRQAWQPGWIRVDQWAAQQPPSRWKQIEVRPGEKGPLVVEVLDAMVETHGKSRERLVVIRTVEANPTTHYTFSNAAPSVPVDELVWAHDDRHRVEEMFELGNGEVGLDHYEVRSWIGWHHHMTLSLLALWFLVMERQRVGGKNTGDHGAAGA